MKYSKYIDVFDFDDNGNVHFFCCIVYYGALFISTFALFYINFPKKIYALLAILLIVVLFGVGYVLTPILVKVISYMLCIVSYPIRYMKVRRLVKNGKCFAEPTILRCNLFTINAEYLLDIKHDWDGCKCTQCGKTRDEQHEWEYHSKEWECPVYSTRGQGQYLDPCYGATCPCDSYASSASGYYYCRKCGKSGKYK